MEFLSNTWIADFQKNYSILIGWSAVAGPWIGYAILKALARISKKTEGSNIFDWLSTFRLWRRGKKNE